MSWLLPVFFCFHGVFDSSGFMAYLLMFGSVIIVPVAGFLGMIPQRILRDCGFDSTPAPITWLVILHWWSWVLFTFSMSDFTWHGESTSMLRTVMNLTISAGPERAIFVGAAIAGVASWIAMVLLAIALEPGNGNRRAWGAAAWVSAVAGPALIAAAIWGGVSASMAERDSAGDSRSEATSRTIDAQRDLVLERYEQQQTALSTAREVIVPGVWAATDTVIDDDDCADVAEECYRITIGYIFTPEVPIDVDEVRARIVSAGWDEIRSDSEVGSVDRIEALDEAGRMLIFDTHANGSYALELRSPSWWVSPEAFREIETGYVGTRPGDRFAPGEWPELELK